MKFTISTDDNQRTVVERLDVPDYPLAEVRPHYNTEGVWHVSSGHFHPDINGREAGIGKAVSLSGREYIERISPDRPGDPVRQEFTKRDKTMVLVEALTDGSVWFQPIDEDNSSYASALAYASDGSHTVMPHEWKAFGPGPDWDPGISCPDRDTAIGTAYLIAIGGERDRARRQPFMTADSGSDTATRGGAR